MAAKSYSLKATIPILQSTKVPRQPILITENESKNFFRASRRMISTTHLYLAAFGSVTSLIYQLPHPWGASDGPGACVSVAPFTVPHCDRGGCVCLCECGLVHGSYSRLRSVGAVGNDLATVDSSGG